MNSEPEFASLQRSPPFIRKTFPDLVWLLARQTEIQREIARLPAVKAGTRQELHARLNLVRDQLYAASRPAEIRNFCHSVRSGQSARLDSGGKRICPPLSSPLESVSA
ncbi:MAG: hypothetical protein ACAI44_38755 [Candidatus Sericytochromatia bacterium]